MFHIVCMSIYHDSHSPSFYHPERMFYKHCNLGMGALLRGLCHSTYLCVFTIHFHKSK